jgi:4'-phosphopantetheinyl transferase
LKILISKYLDTEPQRVEFKYNKQGKPSLSFSKNTINLQFNLSHSNKLGMFAFTKDNSVGVDIEEMRELSNLEDMTEICMSEFEKRWFSKLPPETRNENFFKVWTAKEAFLKAIGTGLSLPMTEVEFNLLSLDDLQLFRVEGKPQTSAKRTTGSMT